MSKTLRDERLGKYVTLQRGNTYKSALLGRPGPVLLGLGSIARNGGFKGDNLKTYGGASDEKIILRPGDIYVSLKDVTQSADLLGAVSKVPGSIASGRLTQDTVKLEFKAADAQRNYIYWLLRTPEYRAYCKAHATGTTNLGLTREDFLSFRVPALSDQRATLIEIIQSIDDKIELNRRMNQTLESMARAIFRSWFVDFDPPEANATRIGDLVRRGYLEVGDGYRAKNSELSSSGLPFARAGNLKAGFDFAGADCFPAARISAVGAKVSRPGDVVFTSKGTVGRLTYVHVTTPQFVYSPQLCYWRVTDSAVIDSRWLYRWMQFGEFRDQCDEVKGQTDMADYVSLRDQQTMCLSLPDIGIQRVLGDVLGSLAERVELNRRMNGTLAALRDALLPKLMSGELRVRDAEKLAGTHV